MAAWQPDLQKKGEVELEQKEEFTGRFGPPRVEWPHCEHLGAGAIVETASEFVDAGRPQAEVPRICALACIYHRNRRDFRGSGNGAIRGGIVGR